MARSNIKKRTKPFKTIKINNIRYTLTKKQEREIYAEFVSKPENQICNRCGLITNDLQIHHVFGGPFRDKSTYFKMLYRCCDECHKWVEANNPHDLKKQFQIKFEKENPAIDFISVFGENYL